MDVKAEFVARLKSGERMTDLCREYGIHRQTGYEVWKAYEAGGVEALLPRSRAPKHTPHKTPDALVELLVEGRKAHPTWGGKKLKQVLEAQHAVKLPAASTITEILQRKGLVDARKKRERCSSRAPTGLREATASNVLWCADYKGQFRLGDGSYCYPLTMTDQFSRKLLCCAGMAAISDEAACDASIQTFRKYGLPEAIRTDNGVPFASVGLAGLTRLSVLWLRLGIELERITPGEPQENGRHERMHRTLKLETARPAQRNLLQQQERFDRFVDEFNDVRPHEALGQVPPSSLYQPSPRPMPATIPTPQYPLCDDVLRVQGNGSIHFRRGERYHICSALIGQELGVQELDDGRWLVTFMRLNLGHLDRRHRTFEPLHPVAPSPRDSKTSPMLPV